MKRFFILIAAMTSVVIIACNKQEAALVEDNHSGSFVINATAEDYATKGVYDADGAFTWKAGDLIGVHMWNSDSSWPQPMGLISGEDTKEATFETTDTRACGKVVFYPWNGWASGTAAENGTNYSDNQHLLYVHLFPTIAYANSEGNAQNLIPLAAKIDDKAEGGKRVESNIKFQQIACGIKVKVSGIPADADKVSLTIPDTKINGWCYIALDDIGTKGMTYSSDGTDTIYITFDASSTITERTFVFPLPPTSVPGITLKLYALDSEIWSKSTSAQPTLTVGQVLKLKDVTVTDAKHVISVGIVSHISNPGDIKVHAWKSGESGVDYSLTSLGTSTSKYWQAEKPHYWDNAQTYNLYKVLVPSTITNYGVKYGSKYLGDAPSLTSVGYVYNYDGDHIVFE